MGARRPACVGRRAAKRYGGYEQGPSSSPSQEHGVADQPVVRGREELGALVAGDVRWWVEHRRSPAIQRNNGQIEARDHHGKLPTAAICVGGQVQRGARVWLREGGGHAHGHRISAARHDAEARLQVAERQGCRAAREQAGKLTSRPAAG